MVQHGEAAPEQENPDRPLTAQGRADVTRVAQAAARCAVRPDGIWHSDKLRARQTAEILGAKLRPGGGVKLAAGLAPKDDPALMAARVEGAEPLMLVGHLPHLSRLASLLLVGDPSKEVITFRMGGMVCLDHAESGWRVKWIVTPEVLGG